MHIAVYVGDVMIQKTCCFVMAVIKDSICTVLNLN
jgi:hypothetical protein